VSYSLDVERVAIVAASAARLDAYNQALDAGLSNSDAASGTSPLYDRVKRAVRQDLRTGRIPS
jgi:hypothetical protein